MSGVSVSAARQLRRCCMGAVREQGGGRSGSGTGWASRLRERGVEAAWKGLQCRASEALVWRGSCPAGASVLCASCVGAALNSWSCIRGAGGVSAALSALEQRESRTYGCC